MNCAVVLFIFHWDQSLQNLSSTGNTFISNEKSPLFLNLIKNKLISLHRWFMRIWTTITLHQMCVFLLHWLINLHIPWSTKGNILLFVSSNLSGSIIHIHIKWVKVRHFIVNIADPLVTPKNGQFYKVSVYY